MFHQLITIPDDTSSEYSKKRKKHGLFHKTAEESKEDFQFFRDENMSAAKTMGLSQSQL